MGNWKYTLDVKDDWKLAKKKEISTQEFICRLLPKLENLWHDSELYEIVDLFKEMSELDTIDDNDFDSLWEKLYDWADENRVWIKPF